MAEAQILNVAIAGGGPGCKAIMDMIFAEKLRQLNMKLIGVACTNPKAVGYRYAEEKGVYTTRDHRNLYKLQDLDMIIELTGHDEVANEILRTKPDHVRVIDHVAARVFWDIFQIEEEMISERKRAEEALLENNRRLQVAYEQAITYAQELNEEITERKRAEEELLEREERYRMVLEASPDPVVVYDMQGRCTYINPAFSRVFGWTTEELIGKKLDYVPDENQPETKMMIDKVLAGESFSDVESRRYTKHGNILDVSISAAIHLNRDGIPVGSVHILRDLTERKRLQAQLQQAQKMEAIGTLAGGIAHDFNNVLMGIQGHTSLVLLHADAEHSHYKHLKGIDEMVQKGADLTKQLLGLARGGKYEVKPTDLNRLVEKNSEMFGRTRKEIRIHTKHQKDIWPVEVDQTQIEQVLLNLYVNAGQAMPDGGDLYIETSNVLLNDNDTSPFDVKPGNYVKVSVTDTGMGMDKVTQQRIFDPFFTTKEIGRGTGLGLSSAYGIINNHGGIINVYSEKGKGTTFNIYLPASEKRVTIREEKLADKILKGTETVLLVDDENMILDVGEKMLKEMGYKVLLANGGKEAVDIYSKHNEEIDLIILDMVMPDMGGSEAYDRIKDINPRVKVVLSSGYSVDGKATKIIERGCDGFIQKPFNMNGLSWKIREVLDKK